MTNSLLMLKLSVVAGQVFLVQAKRARQHFFAPILRELSVNVNLRLELAEIALNFRRLGLTGGRVVEEEVNESGVNLFPSGKSGQLE